MELIIGEINIAFVQGQGLTTLVGEQHKILENLKRNLLKVIGGSLVDPEEEYEEDCYITGSCVMEKINTVAMIKDCGRHCKDVYEAAAPDVQKWLRRFFSKLGISIVRKIDRIELQHDNSTGYKVPPVLPYEFLKFCSQKCNDILDQQAECFLDIYSMDFLDKVELQYRKLLQAVRLIGRASETDDEGNGKERAPSFIQTGMELYW